MRRRYTIILKKKFHTHLLRSRDALGFTQEEMASRLLMSCRTYIELDHGNSCCSAVTFVIFLLYICQDPMAFLEELRFALEQAQELV